MKNQKTIFSDIDGTLVYQVQFENIDPFTSKALPGAVEYLTKMYKQGHHIVLTTARPETLRDTTIQEMDLLGIPFHQLVMGSVKHCFWVRIRCALPRRRLPPRSSGPQRGCP